MRSIHAYKKGFITLIWQVKNKNSNPLYAVVLLTFYTQSFSKLYGQ